MKFLQKLALIIVALTVIVVCASSSKAEPITTQYKPAMPSAIEARCALWAQFGELPAEVALRHMANAKPFLTAEELATEVGFAEGFLYGAKLRTTRTNVQMARDLYMALCLTTVEAKNNA